MCSLGRKGVPFFFMIGVIDHQSSQLVTPLKQPSDNYNSLKDNGLSGFLLADGMIALMMKSPGNMIWTRLIFDITAMISCKNNLYF